MSIKYLVELFFKNTYPPDRGLSTNTYDRLYDIYLLVVGRPDYTTYWDDWGGDYDNPQTSEIRLFFNVFLVEVFTSGDLIAGTNTFYVDGNDVYFHILKKPWQYFDSQTSISTLNRFANTVKDEQNPSNAFMTNSLGDEVLVPPRLLVPSVNTKLADPISGTIIYGNFNIELINDDGKFDTLDDYDIYNTPITLKRTNVDIPTISDFTTIKYGLGDYIRNDASTATITVAEILRSLTDPATDRLSASEYPNLPTENTDKSIPIGWGTLESVPLIKVDSTANKYLALDPDYLTAVSTVYDSDGNSISFSVASGVIDTGSNEGATADVTGKTTNTIGEIITEEIEDKGGILYNSSNWDLTETNNYISISAEVGFYFPDGNLRTLVTTVLKNDSAFLMTKNNGLLTLRKWGETYSTHNIDSWKIMSIPSKDTEEAKRYYMNSVVIQYGFQESTGIYELEYKDTSQQLSLFELYRQNRQITFQTKLLNLSDVQSLATLLLNRFGTLSEMTIVPLSEDTTNINMLDKVNLDLTINGRQFSKNTEWIVREVNPGQDTIKLEAI